MLYRMCPSRSTNPATTSGPIGPPVDHQGVDILLLRLASRDWNDGIGWGNWTPIYATPHDGIFIVETESTSPNGTYVGYIGGRRLAFGLRANLGDFLIQAAETCFKLLEPILCFLFVAGRLFEFLDY